MTEEEKNLLMETYNRAIMSEYYINDIRYNTDKFMTYYNNDVMASIQYENSQLRDELDALRRESREEIMKLHKIINKIIQFLPPEMRLGFELYDEEEK